MDGKLDEMFGTEEYEESKLLEAEELEKSNEVVINDRFYADTKAEILRAFDRLCRDLGIEYFAFGDLLRGCVHYGDFIPEKAYKAADVGLVRTEYERLKEILPEKAEEYGLIYDGAMKNGNPRRLIMVGRNMLVDTPELHVRNTLWIMISPFDRVPTPRDYQYGFYRKMSRLNTRYQIQSGQKGPKTLGQMLAKIWYRRFGGAKKRFEVLDKTAKEYEDRKEFTTFVRVVGSKTARIREEQIYPIERLPFRDFTLPVPHDFSPWTVLMDDRLRFQIASIQKADLEILREFDRICKKLGIGYFVCGGTMLGYVRGGGFIPWDDDIDVGMLRADYDRFLKEGGRELSDRFFLQTRESDPKIPYLFSKIRMNKTEYITEYNERRKFHKGICLDLFPFDYIPNEPEAQDAFRKEVLAKAKIHNTISNMCIPEPEDGRILNAEDLWARITHKLKRLHYRMKSMKRSQREYLKVATRYNDKAEELGLETVASFVPGYTFIKLTDLLPYQDITFEGVPAKIPNRPDIFLTMQYGDFMELPAKHQQIGHPLIRWSVDTDKGFYENPNMRT